MAEKCNVTHITCIYLISFITKTAQIVPNNGGNLPMIQMRQNTEKRKGARETYRKSCAAMDMHVMHHRAIV